MNEVMSTAELLSLISTISFIVAAISFAISVFLWFWFKIATVIGDLSGKNAQKSIARMRASNEKSGNKFFRTSQTNESRGKLTGAMTDTSKQQKKTKQPKQEEGVILETSLLNENKASVVNSEATAFLIDNDVTGLLMDENVTELLNDASQVPLNHKGGKKLTVHQEIMFIHTDEVI